MFEEKKQICPKFLREAVANELDRAASTVELTGYKYTLMIIHRYILLKPFSTLTQNI
jgi:hypothetical protein